MRWKRGRCNAFRAYAWIVRNWTVQVHPIEGGCSVFESTQRPENRQIATGADMTEPVLEPASGARSPIRVTVLSDRRSGAPSRPQPRQQGALDSQIDKRHSSTYPRHFSSLHMRSCASHSPAVVLMHIRLFFQDCAFASIGAGTVAVRCMNPRPAQGQVSTHGPQSGNGRGIWRALCDIRASEG